MTKLSHSLLGKLSFSQIQNIAVTMKDGRHLYRMIRFKGRDIYICSTGMLQYPNSS